MGNLKPGFCPERLRGAIRFCQAYPVTFHVLSRMSCLRLNTPVLTISVLQLLDPPTKFNQTCHRNIKSSKIFISLKKTNQTTNQNKQQQKNPHPAQQPPPKKKRHKIKHTPTRLKKPTMHTSAIIKVGCRSHCKPQSKHYSLLCSCPTRWDSCTEAVGLQTFSLELKYKLLLTFTIIQETTKTNLMEIKGYKTLLEILWEG